MKNFFISFLLILVFSYVLQLFLPWWSMVILTFIVGYSIEQKSYLAFFTGFIAVFILWAGYAYFLSSANDHLLAGKVAELMKALTGGKTSMLFLITGLLGGVAGGLGCLTGSLTAKLRT